MTIDQKYYAHYRSSELACVSNHEDSNYTKSIEISLGQYERLVTGKEKFSDFPNGVGLKFYEPAQPINVDGKQLIEIKNISKVFLLTWVINNICTNHCSYCPTSLHSGKNHHYDWNHAEKFIDECVKRYGLIKCSIAGGEPTLSPFFKDLVKKIHDNGGINHVTSNLARSLSWWEDHVEYLSHISASYHPEFTTSQTAEDEFIEKITVLSKKIPVNVRIMMHPNYWDQCMRVFERSKDSAKNAIISIVRILPNFGIGDPFCDINYTAEQDEILATTELVHGKRVEGSYRELPDPETFFKFYKKKMEIQTHDAVHNLINTNNTNFKNWNCRIGLESLFVCYTGNVFRGNCNVGGAIGNITKTVNWPANHINCNKEICHCWTDVIVSKRISDRDLTSLQKML